MPPNGTLELIRELDVVRLRAVRPSGAAEEVAVAIGPNFPDEAVWETLAAMGIVARDTIPPRLVTAADVRRIGEWLGRTIAYFDGPDEPTQQLWAVVSAVRDGLSAVQKGLNIPLEAYAWLDVQWRDELAEEIRTADNVWKDDELRFELEARRSRCVTEWLRRFETAPFGEWEPSQRTRQRRRGETG